MVHIAILNKVKKCQVDEKFIVMFFLVKQPWFNVTLMSMFNKKSNSKINFNTFFMTIYGCFDIMAILAILLT